MENREEDKKLEQKEQDMGMTYWQRVLSGASGGALIMGGLWLLSALGDWKGLIVMFILMIAGMGAILYGRYGG